MGKKESLNNTTPRLVKEVPEGYKEEMRNGKKVYVFKKEKPTPAEPTPVTPRTTTSKKSGSPKRLPPPTPREGKPKYESEEDVVYLEEPTPIPTQKVQRLRTDLKEEFPSGLQKGYHQYKVPDLTKGANYTDAKSVTTDEEGMPVVFDFTQNKYIKTGEPSIRLTMPVQNDTPTIQVPLKENELPTKYDVVPERLRTPSYNAPKVVNPTVDESIYKGFNDVGVPNATKSDIEFQKKQSENLAKPAYITSQPFAKGGIVNKIKGYEDGGVIGQNDPYAARKKEEAQKKKDAQNAKNRENVGSALGAYGTTYAATAPGTGSQDSTTKAAMGAVSNAGAVGGVIGGVYGIIDKPAREEKNKAEKVNVTYENGKATAKLATSEQAKENAIMGSFLSPSEALTTRMSYEGGMTDLTGDAYIRSLEKKAQEQLDKVTAANKSSVASQAVSARESGELNPTYAKPYDFTGATFGDDKNLVLGNNQQYDPNRTFAKGGIVGKMKMSKEMKKHHEQMCADGGEIEGEGGPKEDKIEAEVKEGSFIVPAENAELAKGIRKLYLKAPNKKANLKQEEGEAVKLSNGEHLFTPEENEYLESIGIELEDLAPNAEHGEEEMAKGGLTASKARMILHDKKVHGKALTDQQRKFFGAIASGASIKGYATGGEVAESDTVDPTKELAKIEAERKAIEAIKTKKESEQTAAEKARLQKFILDARAKDKQNKISKWEKSTSDAKTKLDALNKAYEEMSAEFDKIGKNPDVLGVTGTKGSVHQRAAKEDLLKKIQEAKAEYVNAERTSKYVKDDKNYSPTGELKVTPKAPPVVKKEAEKEAATSQVPVTTKQSGVAKSKTAQTPSYKFNPSLTPDTGEEIVVPGGQLSPNELAAKNAADEKATVQAAALNKSLPQTVATEGVTPSKKRGITDTIGNIDPTSVVGIGQAIAGNKMLQGEVRPIDKAIIDPTYNAAVNRAQEEAKFGLTPEQKFLAEQDIENAKRDTTSIGLSTSAGSGVQAFNTAQSAANQAWRAKLGLKQADTETRMAKQKYADVMAADRANILSANRRQAFNDAMATFQQKQQAGSELVGAGLQNVIGAYRFNKELQRSEDINKASNPYRNV